MTEETAPQTITPAAPEIPPTVAPEAAAIQSDAQQVAQTATEVASVAGVALDMAEGKPVDPTAVVEAVVTSEGLLADLVRAVRRDASGTSSAINDLLAKAEKHFGL